MTTRYSHAIRRVSYNRRSSLVGLILICVALSFACFAAEDSMPKEPGVAGGIVKNRNQESPVSIRIVWADEIAAFKPEGGRLEQRCDLWTVQIGLAVRHESEDLDHLLSTSINMRCGWFPRTVFQLQRVGSDDPVSLTLAPELYERYEVPFESKPGEMRYPHTFEMEDGSYTTFGVTSLTFMDEPKLPGVYQLRFIEDGDWPGDRITAASNDWHTFVLSQSQEPEDSHIKNRIPWKPMLEE